MRVGADARTAFLPSPACGRGVGGEGLLLLCSRKEQSGFAHLPVGELLSLCVPTHAQERVRTAKLARKGGGQDARSQEKVAKEKRHPDGAPSRHPAFRVRGRATGFFDSTSCAGEKLAGILAGHPAGFPPPNRHAIGAPGKAARSKRALLERAKARASAKATTKARAPRTCGVPAFAFVSASGAHDARLLFRGPSAAVRRGRSGRAAGVAMEGNAFSTGQDARPKSPAAPHGLAGQEARQAPPRGGLLFWLLFSWPRKRKVTRAPAGARNRFESCERRTKSPSPPTPLPQAGEGSSRREPC